MQSALDGMRYSNSRHALPAIEDDECYNIEELDNDSLNNEKKAGNGGEDAVGGGWSSSTTTIPTTIETPSSNNNYNNNNNNNIKSQLATPLGGE